MSRDKADLLNSFSFKTLLDPTGAQCSSCASIFKNDNVFTSYEYIQNIYLATTCYQFLTTDLSMDLKGEMSFIQLNKYLQR